MARFGYDVLHDQNRNAAGEIDQPSDVTGDGVFYWATHGGEIDPAGNVTQALMTSDETGGR